MCLRASFKKHIPFKSEKWLASQLGISKISLQPLVDVGFITIATDVLAELAQDDTEVLATETETYTKETENRYGQFLNVKLSDEEFQKLNKKFTERGATERIDALSEYVESKGVRYKSHYATILTWARRAGDGTIQPDADPRTVCLECKTVPKNGSILSGLCDSCREGK